MTARRRYGLMGAGLVVAAALTTGGPATAARGIPWKGAETFSPVTIAPNPARCGPGPENVEARFAGSGIDTEGGAFTVTASGCMNTSTFHVSDLRATDTFLASQDEIHIETDAFTMHFDPSTCVLTNRRPVGFRVAGGTGGLAGASGEGVFDMAMNWPACNGLALPVHVWFEGTLRRRG